MAIYKKGIKIGDANKGTYVNEMYIGEGSSKKQVYKVWSGTTADPYKKLIYYYNPTGTQGLSYDSSKDQLSVSGKGSVAVSEFTVPNQTYEFGDLNKLQPVVAVAESAFQNDNSIYYIKLPKSVTSIGTYAFAKSSLEDINLEYITDFGRGGNFENSQVVSITTPGQDLIAETIPERCFYNTPFAGCSFNSSVKTLSSYSFAYCFQLPEIKALGVTSIGGGCFQNCSDLTDVYLPKVTSIPYEAFYNANVQYGTIGVEGISSASPNFYLGVTYIGKSAFSDNTKLSNIVFSRTPTTIDSAAFYNCYALKQLSLHAQPVTLGDSAFRNCISLSKINMQTTSVPDYCFYIESGYQSGDNGQLVGTIVTDNSYMSQPPTDTLIIQVANIGQYAFAGIRSPKITLLPAFVNNNRKLSINAYAFDGCYTSDFDNNGLSLQNVTYMGENAFAYSNISSVKFKNLETIPEGAFSYCKNLSSANLTGVKQIQKNAFYNCALTELYIDKECTEIGDNAFGRSSDFAQTTIINVRFGGSLEQFMNIVKDGRDRDLDEIFPKTKDGKPLYTFSYDK